MGQIQYRRMEDRDIGSVMLIQREQYTESFIEPETAIRARLANFPDTAWVADDGHGVCAYLVGYRSVIGRVTPLCGNFAVHDNPDTLYLHDLAVALRAIGLGVGGGLLHLAWQGGIASGLRCSSLVSVQDSVAFWQRHGYAESSLAEGAQLAHLATYGSMARYMVRVLG